MCVQWRLKSVCVSMQSDKSSLSAWRHFASLIIQNVPSEYSDQTVNAQANLNLHWAHMSEGMFSDVATINNERPLGSKIAHLDQLAQLSSWVPIRTIFSYFSSTKSPWYFLSSIKSISLWVQKKVKKIFKMVAVAAILDFQSEQF